MIIETGLRTSMTIENVTPARPCEPLQAHTARSGPGRLALLERGTAMKDIPLTHGKSALVDDEDFERVNKYKWYPNTRKNTFYAYGRINGVVIHMHRFILGLTKREEQVDHENHNGLDNRRCNLNIVSHSFNLIQRKKRIAPTVSKYKGVSYHKNRTKPWLAKLGRNNYCGYYTNEVDAAIARDEMLINIYGLKQAMIGFCLNFPERYRI